MIFQNLKLTYAFPRRSPTHIDTLNRFLVRSWEVMGGQYRSREAIIGHETPLGSVPEIKKLNIFFWKHPILEPRFRGHFEWYFEIFLDPEPITNLNFNLSKKNFKKIHVGKFCSCIKVENFQFLKSNFWVTWQFLRDIKSTSESQISWIFRKLKKNFHFSIFVKSLFLIL